MITILKNARLFAPNEMGVVDILIANGKIEIILPNIEVNGIDVTETDLEGRIVVPGFIDKHVHVTGGGGEFGFQSFVDPISAQELMRYGTTTVVGLRGTISVVKSAAELYSKVKSLDTVMTAWMLSGTYSLPPTTITGSIESDMVLIDKVIGCKLALSDDRASFPTTIEIKRLLTELWRGGMTAGKAGILHIHMGTLSTGIGQIMDIAKDTPRLIPHISLTHCARKEELFMECIGFAKIGGMLDITTGGSKFTEPVEAVRIALEKGVDLSHITFSTDGRGGIRVIDPISGEESYRAGSADSNHKEWKNLVRHNILPIEKALQLVTTNPAREYCFTSKGRIAPGMDADLLVLNDELDIESVMTKGMFRSLA